MATLGPLSATPARQPFGVLDSTKLRSLQSVKNCQNALAPSSAPSSLKRRHASPENSDSENVDPNIFKSFSKRKRSDFGDDVSTSKAARYSLTTVPSTKPRLKPKAASLTPRLETCIKPVAPSSAPAAAGRSPTRSRRQDILPRKRFAPPSFGTKSPSLSIAAALSGTLAHKKHKKIRSINESKPKSWFFDIYEETDEQQDYTVNEWTMTQSATILDISDDESKAKDRADRGKENIPPNEVFTAAATAVPTVSMPTPTKGASSRKDMMTDEPRTPLGDLNPADYYPEGLDASSVVLVQDDAAEAEKTAVDEKAVAAETSSEFTFATDAVVMPKELTGSVDLSTLLASSVAVESGLNNLYAGDDKAEGLGESADIEIWESESAKDEEEKAAESIFAV